MNDPQSIEVIVPVASVDLIHLVPCVQSIMENMQRPFRLTVAVYGHMKESAVAELNSLLRSMCEGPWEMLNSKNVGYNGILHGCIQASKAQFIVVIPYDVRIMDPAWFGKMQQPLHTTSATSFCVGTQQKSTLPPVKIQKLYSDGTSMFLTGRKSVECVIRGVLLDKDEQDYDKCYFEALMRSGLLAFYIPSVGTHRVETSRKRRTAQSRHR